MKTRQRFGGRRLHSTNIVALAVGAGFVALAAGPAHAAGTLADTLVTNDVTVSYDVGGTPQTPEVSTETFRVDRMIDIQVTATNDTVYPGETESTATLVYTVQNQGNDFQSIDLSADEFSDTLGAGGLTLSADSIVDIGEYALFIDENGDGVLDAGDTWLDPAQTLDIIALAPDDTVQVLLVAEIPLDATDTSSATYDLVAVSVTNTGDPEIEDTPSIDTTDRVFVDDAYAGNYTTDVAEDGQHSDAGTFNVTSADVVAAKTVQIIDRDPTVDCATATQDVADELYAIPGACIEYTISVQNTGATITATDVAISDILPAEVTFVAFHSSTSADFTSGEPTDVAPAEAGGTVSATEATLAAGETIYLVIRATVN